MKKAIDRSGSPLRPATPSPKKSTSSQKQLNNETYFCHFRNAMYMGGIKAFQKNGLGVVVHDNGASVLSSYHYDLRHGHNIVFLDNCLMSLMYNKGKVTEVTIRVPNYLLYAHYNKQQQLDGKSILLDYDNRTIYYTLFRKGVMMDKKSEKEYSVINRVFDLDNLEFLIGLTHAKVLKYQFDRTEHIMHHKTGAKLSLGFYKKNMLNGLGFTVLTKNNIGEINADTVRATDTFSLKPIERGFFLNSQLTGMGEKWFKNGNYFYGDFKSDVFEGRGLLKNTVKNNWVYGSFQSGNLVELLDYNNEGDTRKLAKFIQLMHERKSSWINKNVDIENPNMFLKEIDRILEGTPTAQVKSLEERKQEVLRKIQDNFICDNPDESLMKSSRNIENYYNQEKKQTPESQRDKRVNPDSGEFDMGNFSKKFIRSSLNEEEPVQSTHPVRHLDFRNAADRYESSPEQSSERKSNIRKVPIEERSNLRSSKNTAKVYEVPTTKQSSSRYRQSGSISPARRFDEQMGRSQDPRFASGSGYSRIQNEGTRLDSKRLIGRSRLFRYLNNDSEDEPPKFNYVPAK